MSEIWSDKDERQYQHIKKSEIERGTSEEKAEGVAARTVNQQRREEGRTPNKTSQGTGNPNKEYEQRTRRELYNLARERNIKDRSKMNKEQLIQALRSKQ